MKGWLEALLRALPCPSFTISQFFFWFSRFMKMRYWAWSSWMPFFLEAKPSKYIYTDCAWNKCILFREKKNLIRGRSLSKLFLIWAIFSPNLLIHRCLKSSIYSFSDLRICSYKLNYFIIFISTMLPEFIWFPGALGIPACPILRKVGSWACQLITCSELRRLACRPSI